MKKPLACTLLLCGAFLARSAEVTVPVDTYKLKNGLRVILSQDNTVPVITVYIIYDVGSRSEEKGHTGKSGTFLLSLETQMGVISQLASVDALGLPKNYLESYTTRIRSVEPDQILVAAKKYIAPGQDTIVVVGDASKIGEALKKFGDVTVAKVE